MSLPLDLRRKVRIHHDHTPDTEWGVHDWIEAFEWSDTFKRYMSVTERRSTTGARGVGYTTWTKWVCIDCDAEAWVSTHAIDSAVQGWLAEAEEHR